MQTVRFSSAQIVFTGATLFLQALLVNGYALNLLRLPADPLAIFVLVVIEFAALAIAARRLPIRVERDPLGLAGFLLVVVGTFAYFVAPTLPSLYAPSYSGDPALHLDFINRIYSTGRIIADDPGGPSLIAATFAHWLDLDPVRVMHPVAALWLALTAGAVFGIADALLRPSALSRAVALVAPFALFVQWSFFAGIAMAANYFYSQVAGQLFLVACAWYLAEYRRRDHALYFALAAVAFLTMGVTYQLWMIMPAVMIAWTLLQDMRRGGAPRKRALALVVGAVAVTAIALIAMVIVNPRLIPPLERLKLEGAIHAASVEGLGGWFLLIPAIGAMIALRDLSRLSRFRAPSRFRAVSRPFAPFASFALMFLAAALAEILALWIAHTFLGSARYWLIKTFFLLPFPLAILSVLPLARAVEIAQEKKWRMSIPASASFAGAFLLLAAIVVRFQPPYVFAPLSETDIQAAVWAKQNLSTRQINYLGPKGLTAQTIGRGIWDEEYPADLYLDLVRLGPRTFEEWRPDPMWGDYLFVSSGQYVPPDSTLQVLFRSGDSAILAKPRAAATPKPAKRGAFGDTFALYNHQLPTTSFYAGEAITATLQVEPLRVPSRSVVWRMQLRDLQNNAAAEARVIPFDDKFPLQRWTLGKILPQTLTLPLSPETRPGLYNVQLGLYRVQSGEALPYTDVTGEQDDVLRLGRIKIIAPKITDHQLAATFQLDWRFGAFAALRGVRVVKQSPIQPGDSFRVDMYWEAKQRAGSDYTVFVQLLDARGNLIAQSDSAPRGGTYPTLIWDPGESIVDAYSLTVPHDAASGDYRLIVGMYHWQTLQRLPVFDADNQARGDFVTLPIAVHVEASR